MSLLRDHMPETAALDRQLFPSIEVLTGWLGGSVAVTNILTPR